MTTGAPVTVRRAQLSHLRQIISSNTTLDRIFFAVTARLRRKSKCFLIFPVQCGITKTDFSLVMLLLFQGNQTMATRPQEIIYPIPSNIRCGLYSFFLQKIVGTNRMRALFECDLYLFFLISQTRKNCLFVIEQFITFEMMIFCYD